MKLTAINLIGAAPGLVLLLARSLELSGIKSVTVNHAARPEVTEAFLGPMRQSGVFPEVTEVKHTVFVSCKATGMAGTVMPAALARENGAEVILRILDRPDKDGDMNVYFVSEAPESLLNAENILKAESIARAEGVMKPDGFSKTDCAAAAGSRRNVPCMVIVRDYCGSASARGRLEEIIGKIAQTGAGCRVIKLRGRARDRRAELAAVYNEHFDFRGLSVAYKNMLDRIQMTAVTERKEAEKKK